MRISTVLITGATGAIGGALARRYAVAGVRLLLQGRDTARLADIAGQCRHQGAVVVTTALDLTDVAGTIEWLDGVVRESPPDLFIANAGMNINNGTDDEGESSAQLAALLDLNVKSTLMMSNHLARFMRSRGHGQIALVSSLAGYYGLPLTPGYSASKAAVKVYGEALRGWLASSGVGVTVIMPGYVESAMCRDMPGPKPFLWQPERAAAVIQRGIAKNRARISFPFPLNWGCWWLGVLPAALSQRILSWLNYSGE